MTYTQTKLLRSKKLLIYGKKKNMYTFQNKTPTFFYLSRQFSLSPPIFGNSIATILFFFSSHFRQLHCHKTFVLLLWAATILFFFLQFSAQISFFSPILATWLPQIFSPSFTATSLPKLLLNSLPYNFSNLVATIFFFLPFSATWLPQFLFFSFLTLLQFQQLSCHDWFFLFRALLLWALHLGSRFCAAIILVTSLPKFKIFFSLQPSHHLSLISHTFCQNFGNGVTEICFFPHLPK